MSLSPNTTPRQGLLNNYIYDVFTFNFRLLDFAHINELDW